MATPSKPIRKSANVDVRPNGTVPGANPVMPTTKSAQPFGSVDKSVYKRPSAPVSPTSVPVNDDDAGKGTGNVRGATPKTPPMRYGVD